MPKASFHSHKSGKEPNLKKYSPFEGTEIAYIENEADKNQTLDFVHKMLPLGVYIGSDFEMVITERYIITYRRDKKKDLLESRLYQKRNQIFLCIAFCQSNPMETEKHLPPLCWKTAFISDGEAICNCQVLKSNNEALRGFPRPVYENIEIENDQLKQFINLPFDLDIQLEKSIVTFPDGTQYPFVIDEEFTDKELHPQIPSIQDDNIGECLRLWNMGVHEEYISVDGISQFIGVTINTNKHMYIFELFRDSIYCRAARFVATNKGIVFNQNFRQGLEAYMIKDNMEAHAPLLYDESLFLSDSCLWNDRSVYWSLSSYSSQEIILHGCQGDIYHWKKPDR